MKNILVTNDDGVLAPGLLALAQEMRMPAVAIADSGNLFGALEFSQYCTKSGIQPIIGAQIGLPARNDKPGAPAPPRARALRP